MTPAPLRLGPASSKDASPEPGLALEQAKRQWTS